MDFAFENHGSVFLVRPLTDAARTHAKEVYADAMTFGGAIAVDASYAVHNAETLLMDGFSVSVDGREIELREDA
jgi:hypothetical protein